LSVDCTRYKGAADGVELLLKAGANVDAKDARGRTPLDWAAYPFIIISFLFSILFSILFYFIFIFLLYEREYLVP
jgi:hypothetical protein